MPSAGPDTFGERTELMSGKLEVWAEPKDADEDDEVRTQAEAWQILKIVRAAC